MADSLLEPTQIHKWAMAPQTSIQRHVWVLWSIAYGLQAKRVFEFGAGMSSMILLDAISSFDGTMTSCGLDNIVGKWKDDWRRKFLDCGRWEYLKMDSRKAVKKLADDDVFDLVLHDGSHTAAIVNRDISAILPRLKQWGILLVHDVEQHVLGSRMREGLLGGIHRSQRKVSLTTLPYSDGLTILRAEDDIGIGKVLTTWCKDTTEPAVPVSWGRFVPDA